MRVRISSLLSLLGVFLMPLLTFADPGEDCIKHPTNPHCAVATLPGTLPVAVPEHWGSLEALGSFALVLIVFTVLIRFKVLHLNSKA
jgi:hypothetical protein